MIAFKTIIFEELIRNLKNWVVPEGHMIGSQLRSSQSTSQRKDFLAVNKAKSFVCNTEAMSGDRMWLYPSSYSLGP